MKKICFLFVVLLSLFLLFGCSTSEINDSVSSTSAAVTESVEPFVFEIVGKTNHNNFYYCRDSITDVIYLWHKTGYAGGLTVMLDPESGLPLTYQRYMILYEDLNSGS